jgi:hypothetical protein
MAKEYLVSLLHNQGCEKCIASVLSLPDLFKGEFGYMKKWVKEIAKQKLSIYKFAAKYEKALNLTLNKSGPF